MQKLRVSTAKSIAIITIWSMITAFVLGGIWVNDPSSLTWAWLPVGLVFLVLCVPGILALHTKEINIKIDDSNNLYIDDYIIENKNIQFVYKDNQYIIIKIKNINIKNKDEEMIAVKNNKIIFRIFYIENTDKILKYIDIMENKRRNFLWERFIFYIIPY